ncbi:jg8927 [Pararge aegeria aegeria]|uniref:Jg8927 protein n=1 Tax=Pararge aegeria aegeria TaxID=348720 RepID=A0A8S4SM30_9NEOP|nr:jg8927 [Pararge aegeria aegeria]
MSTNQRPLLDYGSFEESCAGWIQWLPPIRLMSTVYLIVGLTTLRLPCKVTIPAPWDPNVHRFSEPCIPPVATSASAHRAISVTLDPLLTTLFHLIT